MPTRRRIVATLAGISLLPGCTGFFEEEERDEIVEPKELVIVWDHLVREDEGTEDERVYVEGVVRNEGEREPTYVEVRAVFLDEEDEELDRVIERVEDVTEGAEWPFEVEYPDFGEAAAEVKDYKLEVLTSL